MEDSLTFEVIILIIVLILLRIFYLVHKTVTGCSAVATKKRTGPARTVICIGSGGHTREMIFLLSSLDLNKYSPRVYIMANNDVTSIISVNEFENSHDSPTIHKIIKVPRARIVGQSYLTSVFTTLFSTLYCIPVMIKTRPDLMLCNGPGTCVPICAIAFLLKALFYCDTRIMFVESFCRTKTLSLTGKILRFMADNFIVQWPALKKKFKRAEYLGQIM